MSLFLERIFVLWCIRGGWGVLPYLVAKELLGLNLVPPGVKEEWYQWPIWVGYFNYSNINADYLLNSVLSTMQYGQTLYGLIRDVAIVDPALGTVFVLKAYLYRSEIGSV